MIGHLNGASPAALPVVWAAVVAVVVVGLVLSWLQRDR